MRTLGILLSLVILTICGTAFAETAKDITANVVTDAITVLPDRAEVHRIGGYDAPAGPHSVVVRGFEQTFDWRSLRVRVSGDTEPVLVAVNIANMPVVKSDNAKIEELIAAVELINQQIEDKTATREAISCRLSLVVKLAEHSRRVLELQLASGVTQLTGYTDKIKLYAGMEGECRSRIGALDLELADLRIAQKQAQDKLNAVISEQRRTETVATIEMDGKAGKTIVELTYFVGHASWYPIYDLNMVTSGKASVDVAYKAVVTQSTGVAWEGVDLTLSTSVPSTAIAMPDLVPWQVSIYDPMAEMTRHMLRKAAAMERAAAPSRASKDKKSDRLAESEDVEEEAEMMEDADEMGVMTIDTGGLAVAFKLEEKVSLEPGNYAQFTVGSFKLDAQVHNYITPAVDTDVYIRAVTKNTSAFPMLPGRANCYIDGMLSCTTDLSRYDLGAEMKLAFGIEKRIKVKQIDIPDKLDDKGSRKRLEIVHKYKIESSAAVALDLVVVEAIPVSDNDKIKVNGHKFSDKPAERTDQDICTWKMTIAPASKRELVIEYYIEYPAEWEIYF